jgi:hypothetical protein
MSNPYFAPDLIREPFTNMIISYIEVFCICLSPMTTGEDRTHDLCVTRHNSHNPNFKDEFYVGNK